MKHSRLIRDLSGLHAYAPANAYGQQQRMNYARILTTLYALHSLRDTLHIPSTRYKIQLTPLKRCDLRYTCMYSMNKSIVLIGSTFTYINVPIIVRIISRMLWSKVKWQCAHTLHAHTLNLYIQYWLREELKSI